MLFDIFRYPRPIVSYGQHGSSPARRERDFDGRRFSVANSIVDGLLGHSIYVKSDFCVLYRPIFGSLESAHDPIDALNVRAQALKRRFKTVFLEFDRQQKLAEASRVVDRFFDQICDFRGLAGRLASFRLEGLRKRLAQESDSGEELAEPVMQVASDAFSLTLPGLEDLLLEQALLGDVVQHADDPGLPVVIAVTEFQLRDALLTIGPEDPKFTGPNVSGHALREMIANAPSIFRMDEADDRSQRRSK